MPSIKGCSMLVIQQTSNYQACKPFDDVIARKAFRCSLHCNMVQRLLPKIFLLDDLKNLFLYILFYREGRKKYLV